jgi:hypothetical protein
MQKIALQIITFVMQKITLQIITFVMQKIALQITTFVMQKIALQVTTFVMQKSCITKVLFVMQFFCITLPFYGLVQLIQTKSIILLSVVHTAIDIVASFSCKEVKSQLKLVNRPPENPV